MTVPRLEPANSDFARRVQDSFARQGAMHTLGAELSLLEPGAVDVCLDWAPGLTQQHGFLHAGMVSAALDSACGYAGLTLMPADAAVLTIEFKINLLAPAKGQRFRMEGRVLKPGRTITVTEGRAYAIDEGREKLIATMGCTLMCVQGRDLAD
ncbi:MULTISPECIES: PaaI family thioesterase [Delftia]|uniref:Medium/long-chain acyl-CoA thioesterase YigI n=1 Tax=Delftia lacustris TaxID=558537 RepID=A0A1H3PKQ3_9BURK|nr:MULTISPECIES: PaaI family thioesterase [Delftia]MDC2860630.1 PaaI family thioesterase [Delftia sp. DT-2]MDH0421053.1 PaaI family thioesterase [Delftia tsuruhatensis]OJX23680.1 MAG: phenylacetic acid degradation protein [Delftia sp. 67-8]QFS63437.1 hotdog fold thioesterase [Delftia tsuruhatensis]WON90763.1 PaaI family thioesterase [Delftia sp. UGAL515B_04]